MNKINVKVVHFNPRYETFPGSSQNILSGFRNIPRLNGKETQSAVTHSTGFNIDI